MLNVLCDEYLSPQLPDFLLDSDCPYGTRCPCCPCCPWSPCPCPGSWKCIKDIDGYQSASTRPECYVTLWRLASPLLRTAKSMRLPCKSARLCSCSTHVRLMFCSVSMSDHVMGHKSIAVKSFVDLACVRLPPRLRSVLTFCPDLWQLLVHWCIAFTSGC